MNDRAGLDALPGDTKSAAIVRRANASDVLSVCRIECACFGWGRLLFGLWPRVISHTTLSLVAEADGKVVGYLIAYPRKLRAEDATYVAGIGVNTAMRRHGFGTQLMQAVLAAGFPVWLHVRAGNSPAIEMYQRLQMHELRRLTRFYANGDDALVFVNDDLRQAVASL